eukprot:06730.XXX_98998_99129_1 [CDS] Oithona nana genome sequencing.
MRHKMCSMARSLVLRHHSMARSRRSLVLRHRRHSQIRLHQLAA